MGYRQGRDIGKKQAVVEAVVEGAEPTGDLNSLLNVIFSAKRKADDRAYRQRKNKKRNQQREGR